MDYTTLSLTEVATALEEDARDVQATFGHLDARQLNWQPDAMRWSIAQCYDHLLTTHRLMVRAAEDALSGRQRTFWQRMPVLPKILGPVLIRSFAPNGTRKFPAPPRARPSSSHIPADIILRFIEQNRDIAARARRVDEREAARTVMASPFLRVVIYSVLDGWRLIAAHNRRHIEQARRVLRSPDFVRQAIQP